jgi:hypothetical protein
LAFKKQIENYMSQDESARDGYELNSNVSVNNLPSHGGYTSGMPIYNKNRDADKKRGKGSKGSNKRSNKVLIDDSESDRQGVVPTLNMGKLGSKSSQKQVQKSPRTH